MPAESTDRAASGSRGWASSRRSASGLSRFWAGLQAGKSPVKRVDRFDPSAFRSQVARADRRLRADRLHGRQDRPTDGQVQPFRPRGRQAGNRGRGDRDGQGRSAARRQIRGLCRLGAGRHRLRGDAARALHGARHPRRGAEPGAGSVRRRRAGEPGDRSRPARPDPLHGEFVRRRFGRDRRGVPAHPQRRRGRGTRGRRRGSAEPARVRRIRHHPCAVGGSQRSAGRGRAAVRHRARRLRHGRGRRAAGARGCGGGAEARRHPVRRAARLRGNERCLSHGPAAARRHAGRASGATRTCRRSHEGRRDRLRQRTRLIHAARRHGRGASDRPCPRAAREDRSR